MEIGEVWAYRAGERKPVFRVEVLRIGTSRPPRVKVRFTDEDQEGREEWVSPARLKVPWAQVEEWKAGDRQWQNIRDDSWRTWEDPERRAATHVLDGLDQLGEHLETGFNKDNGLLFIKNSAALAVILGMDESQLTGHHLAFLEDDGTWVTPFETLMAVARRAAEVFADDVFTAVEQEEAKARREAIHGTRDFDAELCAQVDEESFKPARNIIRQWCGKDAAGRSHELQALRTEVMRLGKLIEHAIRELHAVGAKKAADAIERDLGIPIETLRRSIQRDESADAEQAWRSRRR